MTTDKLNGRELTFICDGVGCEETCDTGYVMWQYALSEVKAQGWYIMPDGHGGWDHLCPEHGKERWKAQHAADNKILGQPKLPWLK